MTQGARHATLARPTTVAIHDDRDVTRHATAVAEMLEQLVVGLARRGGVARER
jgi:hypothetical protein